MEVGLDYNDRRVREYENGALTKQFIWRDTELVQERNPRNEIVRTHYVGGFSDGPVPSAATKYQTLVDHLGNVREVLAADGIVTARYEYTPYQGPVKVGGSIVSPTFLTIGRYYHHEGSGLELAQYRAYDPELGRWLSRDPMEQIKGEMAELWEGPNLYSYVGNRPTNVVDPFGLESWGICPPYKKSWKEKEYDAGVGDFHDAYNQMKEANWKNSDKYFHCMANCRAASRGPHGAQAAENMSNWREWFDHNVKGDSKAECDADQAANQHGRNAGKNGQDCKAACSQYRPAGLPAKY